MSKSVYVATPDDTVRAAAQSMAELDTGVLPVGEAEKLVGILTDRDIVLRCVAEARDPDTTPIRDVMTTGVCYCFEDEDIEDVAQQMSELQVRRLPVLDRSRHLVGIVSLGDLAKAIDARVSGDALQGVSEGLPDRTGISTRR
jgi:CBS domain-containing protein